MKRHQGLVFAAIAGAVLLISNSPVMAGDARKAECALESAPSKATKVTGTATVHITDFKPGEKGNGDLIIKLQQKGKKTVVLRSHVVGVAVDSPQMVCVLRDMLQDSALKALGYDPGKSHICLTTDSIGDYDATKEIMTDGKGTGRFMAIADFHLYIADRKVKC